ncbi:MAG TPA: hypothetical protein VFQ19_17190 [Nocardioidaceae bacterium]|jgi:hypothetical protein|nr:hypothetical protein [Nocardioidaceae bacterium]HJR37774.1 hypothetical protein [Nocardioidaceae bacterium]
MSPVALVGLLVVLATLWMVVHLVLQNTDREPLNQRERIELNRLRALVDDLKETAWDHRELDSALATIMIDKIRTHERRGRELGP